MAIQGVLTPAYGRDYKSIKALKADWDAGKDFLLNSPYGSTYVNKEQVTEANGKGSKIQCRYKNNRSVTMLTA